MKRNKLSSNIELTNGEVLSLILDGAIPCLILHPHEDTVDYIEDIVKPIKYSLLNKGFYVKTFDDKTLDSQIVEKCSEESSFTIILLDGLNANIIYSYGFFKGKEKHIFPIYNMLGKDDGNVKIFSDNSNIISLDISENDPNYISVQINNILDSYLTENSDEIIKDFVVENLLISNINDADLIRHVTNLSREIIEYYLGLDEPSLERVNEIYQTISNIEKNNQVNFPPFIYSFLPAVYFNLFETLLLNPVELKKCIINIKQLFEDIFESVNEEEKTRIKRRFADAHTLISVYDEKVENCLTAIDALKEVVENGEHEESSLYRTKVFNNLGANLLAIEDVHGGINYLNSAIDYLRKAITDFLKKSFPLEYGLYQKNLGLAFFKKAELLYSREEFENSLASFNEYSNTYSEESFPKEYFDSKIHLANIHREIGGIEKSESYFEKAVNLYNEALNYYTIDKFPKAYGRIQNELGRCYTLKADTGDSENNIANANSCFEKSLKVFSVNEYPIFYALTKSNVADLLAVDAKQERPAKAEQAIELYEEAVTFLRFSEHPKIYANIQKRLGDSYRKLALVNTDHELCIRAMESYEEALRVYDHENFPVDFARTKIGLSNTYEVLGEIESEPAYLEKAIESYNDSLGVFNEAEYPLHYAEIQTNLGNSYSSLAMVKDLEINCSNAIEAYNSALELINPDNSPKDFAMTKNNLGVAYRKLGESEKDISALEKAIKCFNECIDIMDCESADEKFGMIKSNIGDTYYTLYSINSEKELLKKSIDSYKESEITYSSEKYPDSFALIERKIGKSYLELAKYEDFENNSEAAIKCFTNSVKYFSKEESPEEYALINRYIGDFYSNITELKFDSKAAGQSIDAYTKSLDYYNANSYPEFYSDIVNKIGNQYKKLSEIENKELNSHKAIEYYNMALIVIDPRVYPYIYSVINNNVGSSYGVLAEVSSEENYSEMAVESFRNSLTYISKDEYPLVYASVTGNMGNALLHCSNRGDITARCLEAIDKIEEALDIFDPDQHPGEYFLASNSLAEAYTMLSDYESNEEHCNMAIRTIVNALESCNEDQMPGMYSLLNNSLGNAYLRLSNFDHKIENTGFAIKHYDNSLSRIGDNQYISSAVNNNIGVAYFNLSGEIDGYENLQTSSEYFQNSMELFKNEPKNIQCGLVKNNYAYAVDTMSRLENNSHLKNEAVNAYNCSLRYYSREERPEQYASIKFNLAKLGYELGIEEKDNQKIADSIEEFKYIIELYDSNDKAFEYGTVCYFIARAIVSLNKSEVDVQQLSQAADYAEKSIGIFDSDNYPYHHACNKLILAEIVIAIGTAETDTDSVIRGINAYRDAIMFFDHENYPEENEQIRIAIEDTYSGLESRENFGDDPEKSVEHYKNISQIFTYSEFPVQFAVTQRKLGDSYFKLYEIDGNLKNTENALIAYNKSLNALRDKPISEEAAEIYFCLGKCYYIINGENKDYKNLEQTIESFNKALNYFEEHSNIEKTAEISSYIARLYIHLSDTSKAEGNYEDALSQILSAEEFLGVDPDPEALASVTVKTGEIYSYLGNSDRNPDYLNKAINLYEKTIIFYDKSIMIDETADLFERIGDVYFKIYEFGQNISSLLSSKDFYQKSFKLNTDDNNGEPSTAIREKLGNVYQTLGNIEKESHNFENAVSHFEKSLNYFNAERFPDRDILIREQICSCYIEEARDSEESNPEGALNLFLKALDNLDETTVSNETANIYRSLGKLYMQISPGDNPEINIGKSIEYYKKCLEYFRFESERDIYGQINLSIADSQTQIKSESSLEEAIKHYDEALKCFNMEEHSELIRRIHSSEISIYKDIASTNYENGNFEDSIQIYNKLLVLAETEGKPEVLAEINYGMGLATYKAATASVSIEDYKHSMLFLEKANNYFTLNDNPGEFTEINLALAAIYGIIGDSESNAEYELKSIEILNNCLNIYDKHGEKDKYTEVLKSLLDRTTAAAGNFLSKGDYSDCINLINNIDKSVYSEDLGLQFGQLNLLKAKSFMNLANNEDNEQKDNILNSISCYDDLAGIFSRDDHPRESAEIYLSLGSLYEKLYIFDEGKDNLVKSISSYKNCIAFYDHNEQRELHDKLTDNIAELSLKLAAEEEKNSNLANALELYRESGNYYKEKNDPEKIAYIEKKIAENCLSLSSQNDSNISYVQESFDSFKSCLKYYNSKDFPDQYNEVIKSFDMLQNLLFENKQFAGDSAIEILKEITEYYSLGEDKNSYSKINKDLGQLIETEAELSGDSLKFAEAASYYENYLNLITGEKRQSDFYFTNYKVGEIYSKLEGDSDNTETFTKAINHFKISREYFQNEELHQELKAVDEQLESLYDKLIDIYENEESEKLVVEIARDALSFFSKETNPGAYAKFSCRAGKNYYHLASKENSRENYFNALSFLEESHSVFDGPKFGEYFGHITRTLGSVYRELFLLDNESHYLIKSRDSYSDSLRFFTPDNFKTQNAEIEATIKEINLLLADSTENGDDPQQRINKYLEARKDYGPGENPGKYAELSLVLAGLYLDIYTITTAIDTAEYSVDCLADALKAEECDETADIHTRIFEALCNLYSILIKDLDQISSEKVFPVVTKILGLGPIAGHVKEFAWQNENFADQYISLNSLHPDEGGIKLSIEYYNFAHGYYKSTGDSASIAKVNFKLADSYKLLSEITDHKENLTLSLNYYENALTYYNEQNEDKKVKALDENIAAICRDLGDFELGCNNYDIADQMYNRVLEHEEYSKHGTEKNADLNIKLSELFRKKYDESKDEYDLKRSMDYLTNSLGYYTEEDFPEQFKEISEKIAGYGGEQVIIEETDDIETRIKKLELLLENTNIDDNSERYFEVHSNLADSYYRFGKDRKNYEYISKSIESYNSLLTLISGKNKMSVEAEIYKNLSDSYKLLARGMDKNLVSESINTAIKSLELYEFLGDDKQIESLKPELIENISLYIYLEANTGNIATSIQYLSDFMINNESRLNNEEKTSIKYEFLLELHKLTSIENISIIAGYFDDFKNTADSSEIKGYAEETDKYLIEAYLSVGFQQSTINDFKNAEELLYKASALAKSCNNVTKSGEINYQLALLHKRLWEQKHDKEEIVKSIGYFNQALEISDVEKQSEIKEIVEKLQTAYDAEDTTYSGELDLYDELTEEETIQPVHTGPEINFNADDQTLKKPGFIPEILSEADPHEVIPENSMEKTPDFNHLNQVKAIEKTLSGINPDDNGQEYGEVSIQLGAVYHELAKQENSSKYYGLAITSFRNALKVFTENSDKQKFAEINRLIGNTYNDFTKQSHDLRQFKDMINCYSRSLAYYSFGQFPKENGEINFKLGRSNYYLAENSGDPKCYESAIVNFNDALKYFNKQNALEEFAEIHKNLGVSYGIMAELKSDSEMNKTAIRSYLNALEVFTETQNLSEKALINKYLGISYNALVDGDDGPENLKKALQNYKDSLMYYTKAAYLGDYGLVNKNMGFLYLKLAEYEDKIDNIRNAAKCFEESLNYFKLELSPIDFADINNRLATLYNSLFDLDEDLSHCYKSIGYYEEVLKVYNVNDNPMEFAAVNNNLGISYRALAEYDNKAENCIKAINSYKNSLNVYKVKEFPLQYGSTQNNLGSAYRTLAEERDKAEHCKNAIKAYKEALKVRSLQQMPVQFAATQNNLGVAYRTLSDVENKARNCKRAVEAYEAALIVYTLDKFPLQYATTNNNIAGAYTTLAETEEVKTNGNNAIKYYREAQKVFSKASYPEYFEMIEGSINYVNTLTDA